MRAANAPSRIVAAEAQASEADPLDQIDADMIEKAMDELAAEAQKPGSSAAHGVLGDMLADMAGLVAGGGPAPTDPEDAEQEAEQDPEQDDSQKRTTRKRGKRG